MTDAVDHYETLQVHHHAEQQVISAAYRRLSQMYHPDLNKSADAQERMTAINLAYWVLRDPARRLEYDLSRGTPPREETKQERRREGEDQRVSSKISQIRQPWPKDSAKGWIRRGIYWVWSRPWIFIVLGLAISIRSLMSAFGESPFATTALLLGLLTIFIGGAFRKLGNEETGDWVMGLGFLAAVGGFIFMVVFVPLLVFTALSGIAVMMFGIVRQSRKK